MLVMVIDYLCFLSIFTNFASMIILCYLRFYYFSFGDYSIKGLYVSLNERLSIGLFYSIQLFS